MSDHDHVHAPEGETPTVLHHFMLAMPGTLQPLNVKSPLPKPRTEAEVGQLTEYVAQGFKLDPQMFRYFGSTTLEDEPFVDDTTPAPAAAKTEIIRPKRPGLIVPPGVNVAS